MWPRLRPGRREKQHLVLTPDDIIIPPGFTRTLAGDGPVFNTAPDEQAAAS